MIKDISDLKIEEVLKLKNGYIKVIKNKVFWLSEDYNIIFDII